MLAISRALIAATALAVAAQWSHAQARSAPAPAAEAAAVPAPPVSAMPAPAAEAAPAATSSVAAAAASSTTLIPADTGVVLETAQPLSSATAKRGDAFALRLAEPLVVDGATVLPAGATCHGEVIHAERSRGGGKPGELLLAARYIEHDGRRIALRGFRLSGAGKANTGAVIGAAMVIGPLAMFMRGGQIEIPVGARAQARIAEAVDLSAPTLSSAAPVAPGAAPGNAAAATPSNSTNSTNHPTTGEVVQ
ncbi:hypothetical protein [Lysobacter enzymogenes]|uniref:hypothetical protein n=1 Tax=Lysobacter enzymogenes TaxID=69 RepID=UPI000F4BFE69|nr:hypothetical protein [Lysobacter enzymogenes]